MKFVMTSPTLHIQEAPLHIQEAGGRCRQGVAITRVVGNSGCGKVTGCGH